MAKMNDANPSDFIPDEEFQPDTHDFVADPMTFKEMGLKALQAGGKALDYLGGPARAGLASLVELKTGKSLYNKNELLSALDPTTTQRFPDSAELMRRAGVPEGMKASDVVSSPYADKGSVHPWYQPEKGGFFDPSVRGAGGFATDMATDPLTWLSMGTAGLAKKGEQTAAKALIEEASAKTIPQKAGLAIDRATDKVGDVLTKPSQWAAQGVSKVPVVGNKLLDLSGAVSNTVSKTGENLYRSGVAPIAHAAERFGKLEPAQQMMDLGIKGSAASMPGQLAEKAALLKDLRDKLMQQAESQGATASLDHAADPFLESLSGMVRDRRLTPEQATKIFNDAVGPKLAGTPHVDPTLMTQWKTDLGASLPGATYDELAKSTPSLANQLKQKLAGGYQKEVENAVERGAGAGVGDTFHELNAKLGTTITPAVQNAAQSMANAAEKKKFLGASDAAFLAGGSAIGHSMGGHTLEGAATLIGSKKLAELMNSTWFRTHVGDLLKKTGDSRLAAPLIDASARREVIDKTNPYSSTPSRK